MKIFLSYISAIIIGLIIIIVFNDIRWFLFYLLISLLLISYQINRRIDYNRKMLRVFRVGSDVKLLALIEKFKISREEMKKIFKEIKTTSNKEDWESLKKDTRDITGAILIDEDID